MPDTLIAIIVIVILSLLLGGGLIFLIMRSFGRRAGQPVIQVQTMSERIRSVGRLIGLEVHAKEIATSTKGWSWLPPLLLSQAKIAMIFHFEKQYGIDLARIRPSDVEEVAPAGEAAPARYRLRLPPLEGQLRLTDVTPYDIQAGRILGLVDVIQMNAQTQGQLIKAAQEQAAELFQRNAARYEREARHSIERRLQSFLRLFDAEVEMIWPDQRPAAERVKEELAMTEELEGRLAGSTR